MRVLLLLGDMKPHAWVATSAIALKFRLEEVLARLPGPLCGAGAAGTRAWSPAKKVATILPLLPALPPALARAVSVGRPRVAPAGWSASADPCCPTEASWRPQLAVARPCQSPRAGAALQPNRRRRSCRSRELATSVRARGWAGSSRGPFASC